MRTVIYSTTHQSAEEEKSSKVVKEQSNLWIASSVIYRKIHENIHGMVFQHKKTFREHKRIAYKVHEVLVLRHEFIN